MSDRNQDVNLGNWREAPQNRWSFHHVRELIPTVNIPNQPNRICALRRTTSDLDGLHFIDGNGGQRSLAKMLTEAWTDALCVLHKGSIVYEWYAPHYGGTDPHILFSVSKSITGALAGVLVEQGRLAVDEQVSTYIPDAAGSICVLPRDLARFGQVMCGGGRFNDRQVIPKHWVEDCRSGGSRDAWRRGSMSELLPNGKYRNQWYQTGNPAGAFCAISIHGQWIYVDPAAEVVIVKVSSQPDPIDDALDAMLLQFYGSIVNALN